MEYKRVFSPTSDHITPDSLVAVERGMRNEPALLIDGKQVLGFGVEVSVANLLVALNSWMEEGKQNG